MSGIDAKEFIEELVFCIAREDVVKAKALLQFAADTDVDTTVQKKALIELAKGPDKIILPLLEYLLKIDISSLEIQDALYELILDKAYNNTRLVIAYILKNDKKTRLLFLKAAGELQLTETAEILQTLIASDTDKDIRVAAISALGNFRLAESLTFLADLARQTDMPLQQAAISAISQSGTDDAVDLLIGCIGEDEHVNTLVVEALADIQQLYALEKLTELLKSSITIVRDTAIDHLMKLGHKATPILTQAFQNADADYLVHLLTTLGYIGDPAAIGPILDIVNTQPADANIRQAAFEAMERIPSPKTAISLVQGLQDPVEAVRMSAARAIDKNLSRALVAGLKNVVREGSSQALQAVAALIDSDASNIFNFLIEEETFKELARTHLATASDSDTKKTFLNHIKSIGHKQWAQTLAHGMPEQTSSGKTAKIYVIDDSKMMLKLYTNKLTAIGFKPVTFDRPEEALSRIFEKKPDLVITDLNMPHISGLELTREIRRKFTRQELPILMITTQSDFVEEKDGDVHIDRSVLSKSGINRLLHKPFTNKEFQDAIGHFLTL